MASEQNTQSLISTSVFRTDVTVKNTNRKNIFLLASTKKKC